MFLINFILRVHLFALKAYLIWHKLYSFDSRLQLIVDICSDVNFWNVINANHASFY